MNTNSKSWLENLKTNKNMDKPKPNNYVTLEESKKEKELEKQRRKDELEMSNNAFASIINETIRVEEEFKDLIDNFDERCIQNLDEVENALSDFSDALGSDFTDEAYKKLEDKKREMKI
jgi:hypothetical protein